MAATPPDAPTPATPTPPTPPTPAEVAVRSDGSTRWIALDRPASRNGLTVEINRALIAALHDAAADPAVRVVVLTGAGGNFCSGLDLREVTTTAPAPAAAAAAERSEERPPQETEDRIDQWFHGLVRAVVGCPKPVIALVDGAAVGFGCDLALACDLRLGTPRTRFGEIFVQRGLMPDGGGTYHLPRLLGAARALELMFTGEIVDAEESLRLGLVSRLFPVERALSDTAAFAARLAGGAPLAQAWIKRAVRAGLSGTLEDSLAMERRGQGELLRSADFAEGVAAFFERRAPRFQGR